MSRIDSISVSAPSRLHFGLFDVSGTTSRTFGGAGLMISEPRTVVTVSLAEVGMETNAPAAINEELNLAVERLQGGNGCPSLSISIQSSPPSHSGFGSKTSVILSALAGANELLSLGKSQHELKLASARGRTSGVGIHGFFSGGLVVDAGQSGRNPVVPTSVSTSASYSTQTNRIDFPDEWKVCLFSVPGTRYSGKAEVELFRNRPRVSEETTLLQISACHHEVVPAIIEKNFADFLLGHEKMTSAGFKQYEISRQSNSVKELISQLKKHNLCVGMSSIGPLVYTIVDDLALLKDLELRAKIPGFEIVSADNRGWVING
ncbi:hypothetical protein CH272_13450 [Rhodococcus sp. 05-340-1]|uniref:beta-ribofuranosylaminobenzene 5'-phosphate synthase family protein n=1 Tax=unclassified Rhodococcus (in: high G+C Gram-positive bacteria) TaxID=192944 RepID=UPI000B9A4638|nr:MULTISPECIES: beta-ribofuranosylaminobenzene 5'-phosphate synthase family protein [unclassified Rhodococcus (in: high G+C Gram-positive bacteria)]OZD64251.1 hypothetical protein CH271_21905 [Rhodococcus sp. 05-340-2]OZD76668.1 hypothetical protein CH272_13450 [Rhodococcus sp. 05-340-1]